MYEIHACHPGSMCDLYDHRQIFSTSMTGTSTNASSSFSLKSTHLVRTVDLLIAISLYRI